MKKSTKQANYLWDTGALFLFFADHQKAKAIMTNIHNSKAVGYIPRLVLVEFYYKTMEKLGKKTADYQTLLLKESKNNIITFDENDVSEIGKLKFDHRDLSIVDSVIGVISRNLKATIITTDNDFRNLKGVKYIKLEF